MTWKVTLNFTAEYDRGSEDVVGIESAARCMTALASRKCGHVKLESDGYIKNQITGLTVVFPDQMEAAIFLASISEDQERASLFRTFWGDGE
jgi:hypothetical protein